MVTLHQIKTGMIYFAEQELLPHLDGMTKFGAALYLALVVDSDDGKLRSFFDRPAISMLGLMDDSGNIDIDKLRKAALDSFDSSDRLEADVPVVGRITFHKSDVDKVYRYICQS